MPNWKNAADYKFEDDSDNARWCWEFMRRNAEYRSDYEKVATIRKKMSPNRKPPRLYRGKDAALAMKEDEEGRRYALKWGQGGIIATPKQNTLPHFLAICPFEPNFEQVQEFYARPDEDAPVLQMPGFATLVFDVRKPLNPQLERAKAILQERRQHVETTKPPHKGKELWPLYLRLLDAIEAGAETSEIIQTIEYYKKLPNETADGYTATDRVSDHKKRAQELLADPLSLIR